jgi:hypothetical protein
MTAATIHYITNEQGERVGVVLDWQVYSQLIGSLTANEECLVGMSVQELEALASCKLASSEQHHLNDLITRHSESTLSADEMTELDDLLAKADQLTILKTRARYTLKQWSQNTTS